MVAVVGIIAPLVGPIIQIGKLVAAPIKRQFTYLCCFKSNIQSLKNEAQNLEKEKEALRTEIEAPENNGREIIPNVQTWLENANRKIDEAGEISKLKSGCWDIISRYQLSKKAVKKAGEMEQLMEDCKKFDGKYCSSPPPAARVPIPLEGTYEFQSRKQIEDGMVEALRASEIRIAGICGLGGVGKTTMAKRIMNRMRDENKFQETVMAVVSQQVDILKIQDAIAESLGLKFEETTLIPRAAKLRARLTGADTKRMLVVLDDVWETLKLDDLGIPCGNEWCTILLTSRNREVLNKMGAEKICPMEILSETEAWFLFKENAGNCVDDENLHSIAKSVAEECKGLPIALVAIAGALKDEANKRVWEGALEQLRSFNPEYMQDVIKEVYNPLKLSYTYLRNRDAHSLFLLCSLFPEDYDISLEELALYSIGLRMFSNFYFSYTSEGTMGKVRNRVFTIVRMLKNRFLLLEGEDEHHVRMHDVVRDVANHIATNEAEEGIVDVKFNLLHSSREYTCQWVSVSSKKKVIS